MIDQLCNSVINLCNINNSQIRVISIDAMVEQLYDLLLDIRARCITISSTLGVNGSMVNARSIENIYHNLLLFFWFSLLKKFATMLQRNYN